MERFALQTSSNTRRFHIGGETEVWYLHYLTGSPTNTGQFHVLTNKPAEFIMPQTVRAADLACCAKGQALRIARIQNLTRNPPSSIFSICVFYIMVLPRRSALIIPSLKQHAHTLEKKPNTTTHSTEASCPALWSSPAPTFQCVHRN